MTDKILVMGDIHLSDRPPSSCTDTYLDDLFDLLAQTVQKAYDQKADAVVWAGDVFHLKQPSRTTHRTVQRAIEIVQAYPVPLYIVPGNHDVVMDRMASLEGQPLGVLFKAGAKLLQGWADDLPLYGVPWLQFWDDETVSEALREFSEQESPGLVVTHAPLYPPGFELPYENYPTSKWAEAMDGKGFCYYGHVHEAHGIYDVGGVTFCNHGALSRGSLHEHNLKREISVTLWTAKGFERIPLDYKPAEEVFRLVEAEESKEAQVKLDDFLASVGQAKIEITSVEAVLDYIRQLGLGDALVSTVEELLAEVSKEGK